MIAVFDHTSPAAFAEMLKACGACSPAQQWANNRGLSLEAAFIECDDPEWFKWLIDKWRPGLHATLNGEPVSAMRRIIGSAAEFARSVLMIAGVALTGYGYGDGSGYGYGYGSGYGSGDGNGDGDGDGYGTGDGNGYGTGDGNGWCEAWAEHL